jgi:hypothetical protein
MAASCPPVETDARTVQIKGIPVVVGLIIGEVAPVDLRLEVRLEPHVRTDSKRRIVIE